MTGVNGQDARALTYLAMRIRAETHGAGPWDEPGTFACIAKLDGQNLATSIERVVRHASDPKAKTPGAILGAYVPPPPAEVKRGNPKAGEECRRCGRWRDLCVCAQARQDEEPVSPNLPPVADVNPALAKRLADRIGGN